MNPTPIYISFLETVYSRDVEKQTLDDIIDVIRLGTLADRIKELKGIKDDYKRKQYKSSFPAFFPTVLLGTKNILGEDSQPTGIIQFDVDKKDNPKLDFDLLSKEIEKLPETIYAFKSPSEGLKFGLLTDFQRALDEETQTLQDRFKQAYRLVSDYVVDSVAMPIIIDDSAGHLKHSCFLSSDPNAYFNPDCKKLAVDASCSPLPVKQSSYTHQTVDQARIVELLSSIPADYDYNKRLPINAAVLAELGHLGIPLLERHWITKSRTKLNNDLKGILKQVEQGRFTNNIGTLINAAKDCKEVNAKQRNSLKPQATDYMLEPLLSAAEAEAKLKDIVQDFFTDKLTRFINFSAGAGKTYMLIKYLDELNPNAKILYLVKTHQLADEIKATFDKVREERLKQAEFKEKIRSKSGMIAMKGRNMLCVNQTVKEKYNVDDKENAIPIHADQCTEEGCHLVASCAYIDQFNTVFQGIRVMMFNEYFNMPSRWFNGVDEKSNPAKRKWQPDFIIIDENIIDKDDDWDIKYGRFKTSIDKIIHEVENGEDLADTIIKYAKEVCLDDDKNNPEDKPIAFINTDQYIKELAERKSIRFSPILRQLARFAKTEDKSLLKGMRVENGSIVQSSLKLEAGRYQNIPTLYLDATANKEVVKHLLPNIQFHSIQVKAKSDINVYQLANYTVSIKRLKDQKTLNQLINGLKKLIIAKGYSNVGLISYKNITGISGNFARYLAGELGIELFEHFGNLRGVNKFSDVDCLIIAGRYSLNPIGIKQYAYAVFGDCNEIGTHHENRLVRMKDGSANLINCDIRDDPDIEAIYDHFSASETKQAIGRGRLIHGKPKDIYYLANESIGTDIEITGFIYKDDIFYQPLVADEYWVKLIETGFIRDNQPDLMSKFDWDKNKLQINREKLEAELIDAGFEYCSVRFTDKNKNRKDWGYFVKDFDKLKSHLVAEGIKNPKIELKGL